MPTVSYDITAQQASRVQTAVGKILGLGRDATAAEARAYHIKLLKDAVISQERGDLADAISVSSLDIA